MKRVTLCFLLKNTIRTHDENENPTGTITQFAVWHFVQSSMHHHPEVV